MRKFLIVIVAVLYTCVVQGQVPCSFDNNQGDPNQGYLLFFEGLTAYVLVDPTQDGTMGNPGCSSTGDFVLTSIEWPIADAGWFDNPNPANGFGTFQFGVYALEDQDDPCAGVGSEIWLSPVYSKTVQTSEDLTEYFIPVGAIPLNEKFFITWKILSWQGSMNQVVSPVWDGLARPNCRQFFSGNDGVNFVPHEDFFNSTFGWIDFKINGYYEITEFAEVQFIHTSADGAANVVDVRVNGEFPDPSFDNLNFKCATNTVLIPAGSNEITINPANSVDDSNPIATFTGDYSDGDRLIGMIHGIASSSGYSPGAGVTPLSITYIDPAQVAAEEDGETDLVFFHAVTDVTQVDLQIVSGPAIANGVDYGNSSGYIGIDTDNESVVLNETGIGQIQDYYLPLDSLDLDNLASVLVVLGFENTSANSNGESLGMWISNPAGGCLEELNFINSLEDTRAARVSLFPNPASDNLLLSHDGQIQFRSVDFYSVTGELVFTSSLIGNYNQIDVEGLRNGFYTLIFKDENASPLGVEKLIISK